MVLAWRKTNISKEEKWRFWIDSHIYEQLIFNTFLIKQFIYNWLGQILWTNCHNHLCQQLTNMLVKSETLKLIYRFYFVCIFLSFTSTLPLKNTLETSSLIIFPSSYNPPFICNQNFIFPRTKKNQEINFGDQRIEWSSY